MILYFLALKVLVLPDKFNRTKQINKTVLQDIYESFILKDYQKYFLFDLDVTE